MQNIIIKIGRSRIVILITLASIVISVIVTITFMVILGQGMFWVGVTISIIAPMLIAPTLSWYMVGLLIRVYQLEKVQRELATFDELTGLMMRRAFFENCETLRKTIERNKNSISLAYVDIDNFKKINDIYGHAGGDEVLKSFATGLHENLRKSDLIGRIGGEEFAIALPYTDLEGSIHVLEKIRLSSKKNDVKFFDRSIEYTISIGVTLFDESNPVDLDQLTRQADVALYKAKNSGKNCIVQYGFFDIEGH